MFKLRPYQTDMVRRNEECWAAGIKNPVSVLPTGAGKCYRKGTMIVMSDGKRKAVEGITVGDQVMGPDSKPRNVLALGRGSEMMYEVMPTKGEPYYVNESHILSLRSPHHDQVVNIPLLEALKKPAIFWRDHKGWRVPNILTGDTTYELVAIRHVRPVGVEPYYGFMLDGDHLHLLGDCTVSHNTVIASEIIRREQERDGYFAAIAHRQELVSQISLALARQGVMHDVVAPRAVRRFCGDLHNKELGRCFVSTKANGFVGGVDTIVRRDLGRLKDRVSLMFQDEAHHVLADNKWGKAAAMFPHANGLFVTATPCRADGKGLGRHADGLFDTILEGPTMREIIRMGSLTDYKIYAPPSNIDLANVAISRATGDYNQTQLQNESKRQRRVIVGNVVHNYIDYTPNTQCVAFVVDVATAMQTAEEFNAQGIRAVALSANNTDAERHEAITKFKNGDIKVIVNVDLLGEGFDCPAIESVIMARPTMSYGLYCQQFGRSLRLLDGKKFGIVVDMVGNVKRHGLPDAPRQWSLDRSERKGGGADDTRPTKVCPECTGEYEVGPTRCPYCGYAEVVAPGEAGGGLIEVDAGLRELTAEELAEMRGEIDKLGREWHTAPGMSKQQYIQFSQHNKTVRSQKRLRDAIAYYAGACKSVGMDDRGIHIQFTTLYGTSITEAQLLRPKDADALSDRIESDLVAMGVDRSAG